MIESSGPGPEREPEPRRIERDLRALGVRDVRADRHSRMLYSTDASIYQVEPLAVVVVSNVDEAEVVMDYCRRERVPLLPRGGGTALAGQSVNRAVILDFSAHCRRVLSVDPDRQRAWVEPGVVLDQLNEHLEPMGLMFGPDVATSSHANLGGMIGNNSAGAYSIRYGRTVEHLHAIDARLVDGSRLRFEEGSAQRDPVHRELMRRVAEVILPLADEIDRRYPRIRRHVDGYNLDLILAQLRASTAGTFDRVNLAHLICGSEGTLAVTLGAELALVERPAVRGLVIAAFRSVDAALEVLGRILEERPAAVEMVDEVVIQTALLNAEHRGTVAMLPSFGSEPPGAVLYVEHFAASSEELLRRLDALERLLPGAPIKRFLDAAGMKRAWRLRKAGEPLLHAIPGERKPITFVEDTAVDPSRLREFVREFREIVERHGTRAAYWAHASVGCLHIRPMVDLRDEGDRGRIIEIATEVADLVVRYGGALSGEHGDGRVRTPLLERVMGRDLCEAFRRIKAIFDPEGLLNPGNIVDTGNPLRILEHHRVRPHETFAPLPAESSPTFYHYDREGGFGHAIEQCNGAGLCRRMRQGAMCPSYRATLDERHATRGRGNALRLAITGQLGGGAPSWRDPATHETLSLCLSCKACKSECPSNVDIAKLKAEYTAHSFKEAGRIPLATRLFGRVRQASRLGSALWPVSNWLGRAPGAKAILSALANIDPRREPLSFGPPLTRWMRRRRRPETNAPVVLLLADCFSAFQETGVGRAAVTVLEAFGYRVELIDAGCCGRPLISVGMLAEASRVCATTISALRNAVAQHHAEAIVVCEPSCMSAMRDDWLELRMGVDRAEVRDLSQRIFMVDEFLDRRWDDHPRRPSFDAVGTTLLVHGHCHQEAVLGTASAGGLMRRLWGDQVEVLDSGCCGMAGSFGYTRDRYDLSLRIGEQSLFGRLRDRGAGEIDASSDRPAPLVIAAGTSCRQQLRDGMDLEALHPIDCCARVLANAVPSAPSAAPVDFPA